MLRIERQRRMKELIDKKKNIKISELSRELGVSEMTIHRDLKPLIDEGYVMKTFGGVALARDESPITRRQPDECIYCSQKIDERLAYRLILPDNVIETACCAHCGLLRHRQLGDEVSQALCHDFLINTTISAALAWYVMDTSIKIGCCQPQVLTFEQKEHAEKFVKGFGGNIYSFREAMDTTFNKMQNNSCCGET